MKKLIALLLMGAFLATITVGCKKKEEPPKETPKEEPKTE